MVESIHVLGEGGSVIKMDLPLPDSIADRLRKGYLREVDEDGSPIVESERPTHAVEVPSKRPPINAVKSEWIGWAVAESARRGDPITPDDAEALTKDDLIERYGTDASTPAAAPDATPADEASTPTTPVNTVTPGE